MSNTMQRGLVSVMMPAYNAENYIVEAIDSVLAQTTDLWELIIVNDGSQDRTAEIAAAYTDPRIRLIHQENGGEAAARNTALDHLKGEYVAFLDADDAFLPNHLDTARRFLEAHTELDAVYGDGIYIDGDGKRMEALSSQRRGPFTGWIFPEVARASDVFGPPTCTLLRSRHIFERGLRFDTRIVIGPDWDFLTRYCEWTQFGNVPDQTVLYRVHTTNITVQVDRQRRARYMALCREKAIHLERFGECDPDVRTAVFYDLLVNLLAGQPQQQTAASEWPQFGTLPQSEQARLLRLMASKAILAGGDGQSIKSWLARAGQMDPQDRKQQLISALYRLSPAACQALLRTRANLSSEEQQTSPFANLNA